MVRFGLLFRSVFALTLVLSHVASAAPEINRIGNTGWGKLNTATDTTPHQLKALVGLHYARASNLLGSGDVLQVQGLDIHFAYDITRSWGAGVGATLQGVADSQFYNSGAGAATLFDAFGTYHRMLGPTWGVGGLLRLELPSGFSGLGVVVSDLALRLEGLATWRASDDFTATYTLGYTYDRRDKLIATFNPIQRLLFDAGPAHRLTIGAGAAGWLPPIPWVSVGWFGELLGEYSTEAGPNGMVDGPIAIGLGLRASPWRAPNLLVSLGCDIAVTGTVQTQSPYPGLMPWNLFLQVALTLDAGQTATPPPPPPPAQPTCKLIPTHPPPRLRSPPAHCPRVDPNTRCDPNTRAALLTRLDPNAQLDPNSQWDPNAHPSHHPVVAVVPVPVAPAAQTTQVMLSGFVLDIAGAAAPGAIITLPQYPDVRLATNPTAGYFRTPPINCDANNILEVVFSAKNMIHQTHRFACTQPVLPAYTAKLEHGRDINVGEVTFIVRVRGRVPQEEVVIHLRHGHLHSVHAIEAGGTLQLRLRTGLHHATIVAPGYETRIERFALGANDHVVFNVELSPTIKPGKPGKPGKQQ